MTRKFDAKILFNNLPAIRTVCMCEIMIQQVSIRISAHACMQPLWMRQPRYKTISVRLNIIFQYSPGGSLARAVIISSHTVHSEAECSLRCLKEERCVGFNYRSKSNNKYVRNCQISNKTQSQASDTTGGSEEWTFYQYLKIVSVYITFFVWKPLKLIVGKTKITCVQAWDI
jgi:hypothetical protein